MELHGDKDVANWDSNTFQKIITWSHTFLSTKPQVSIVLQYIVYHIFLN